MTHAGPHDTERQVGRPGARSVLACALAGLALAGIATAGYAVLRAHAGTSSSVASATPGDATYGSLPGWLPTSRVPTGRLVQASAVHPWIGIEGDTVLVDLAGPRVLATLVGPRVPSEGHFPLPATTPCTFTLTLRSAGSSIVVDPRAITIFDERGHRYRPRFSGPAGPRRLAAGRTTTLEFTSVLPTGSGEVVWTTGDGRPIVSYEFVTEID